MRLLVLGRGEQRHTADLLVPVPHPMESIFLDDRSLSKVSCVRCPSRRSVRSHRVRLVDVGLAVQQSTYYRNFALCDSDKEAG